MASQTSRVKKILETLSLPVESSNLLQKIEGVWEKEKARPFNNSLFKHSARYQIRERSLTLARYVLDNWQKLSEVRDTLQKRCYSLGANAVEDNFHSAHLLIQVDNLIQNPKLQQQVLSLKKTILNPKLEQIIRKTLRLKPTDKIDDRAIQLLCLSAFFTPMRQSVGSCFATAPAILVQTEQPHIFFQDLEELLNTGLLKRVSGGIEHAIPLSPSWGQGALDYPFVFISSEVLGDSFEVIELFKVLALFEPKWSAKERKKYIEKTITKKLNVEEGKTISLRWLLKNLTLMKYQLSESDIQRLPRTNLSPLRSVETASRTKREAYEEDLYQAMLHMVQLEDHLFLKSWEYTLASFAESKSKFFKWNLFTSLGLDSKEEQGLSQTIYHYLEEKLEWNKREIERLNQEYEQEFYRVKYLEKRVQDTESDRMATWARVEYQNHVNDLNQALRARDQLIDKTNRLSNLLPKLVECYDSLFPRYFQELYDAQMQDVKMNVFEDTPAGFRLIYKHGRSDPSLWTFIYTEEEFLAVLKSFFIAVEPEVLGYPDFEDFQEEILEIGTRIVNQLYTESFIEHAYARICKRYKVRLPKRSELEKLPYKPWSYISGGTLTGLMTHYFKREGGFYEEQKKVASPTELLAYLIDLVRLFPESVLKQFAHKKHLSLLSYSPTHAFLMKPGLMPLEKLWEDKTYSYTWIKENVQQPSLHFVSSLEISPLEVLYFLEVYTSKNPYLHLWLKENIKWPNYSFSVKDFKTLIGESLPKIPAHVSRGQISEEILDSWIYEFFPLSYPKELSQILKRILLPLVQESKEKSRMEQVIEAVIQKTALSNFISSLQLFEYCQAVTLLFLESSVSAQDWPYLILEQMRALKLAMPKPLIFADTNWPFFYFAFVVNPAHHQLELWRVDFIGRTGAPMRAWDSYFSESQPSLWSVFTRQAEYRLAESNFGITPV